MKQAALIFAMLILADVSIAQSSKLDPVEARFDNACAFISGSLLAGVVEKDMNTWVEICSGHPVRIVCDDTVDILRKLGNAVPAGLKCGGKYNGVPPKVELGVGSDPSQAPGASSNTNRPLR